MRTNLSGRIAAVLVGLEGLGLAALTVREIVAIASGDTGAIALSIALAVLTLLGAAAVIAFAFAIWRGQSWGRSGGIVTQLLILAVALGAATGAFADPAAALALAALTLVGAAAVVAFAVAIWLGQSWGRSGGIVTQLLILAVALGAATGSFADPSIAWALAVPALIVLVLLVLAVRDAGRAARRSD